MTERKHTKMHGTLNGRFSGTNKTGIYAVSGDGGKERLVGQWQRQRCAPVPEIKSLTLEDDFYVLEMSGSGCKLYLSA